MKRTTHAAHPKDSVFFTSFALVDKVPKSLSMESHLFPFAGEQTDPDDRRPRAYLWGVYGTGSQNRALFLADAAASRQHRQLLTVGVWYRVDNFERVRSLITQEMAEEFGFLHLDRLKTDYREQIRQFVLEQLRKDVSSAQFSVYASKSLDEIIVRHPKYARALLEANRKINVVVHPVRQLYDEADTKPVYIATVRAIKARIMAAEVRYMEHIKVLY